MFSDKNISKIQKIVIKNLSGGTSEVEKPSSNSKTLWWGLGAFIILVVVLGGCGRKKVERERERVR